MTDSSSLDDYGEIFQLITSVVFPFPAVKEGRKKETKSAESVGEEWTVSSSLLLAAVVCREFFWPDNRRATGRAQSCDGVFEKEKERKNFFFLGGGPRSSG